MQHVCSFKCYVAFSAVKITTPPEVRGCGIVINFFLTQVTDYQNASMIKFLDILISLRGDCLLNYDKLLKIFMGRTCKWIQISLSICKWDSWWQHVLQHRYRGLIADSPLFRIRQDWTRFSIWSSSHLVQWYNPSLSKPSSITRWNYSNFQKLSKTFRVSRM